MADPVLPSQGQEVRGQRKLKATYAAMLGLLIGYVFSIYAKADPSMFTGYAGTMFAILTAYIWGNQRVHQFQAKPQ